MPKSCCKDQTVDNCNINVTSHLDKIYSDQVKIIYSVVSCSDVGLMETMDVFTNIVIIVNLEAQIRIKETQPQKK